ncbi:transcriptional regulator [Rhodobacteraceae phage LS06-2018-MD07]|jgi:DNA invertase Pin-like site-specific DNA recombinase|nr:transcriptional regulator [Rhodobacteraceae phage LS06-2018-MD07]
MYLSPRHSITYRWFYRTKKDKVQAELMADSPGSATGRGENNSKAKLTQEQVLEIRRLLKGGKTATAIAKSYGVHQVTISRIKNGQRWGHLSD